MTNKTDSIASLLKLARHQLENVSDSAALDAELLLAHCLNKSRTHLFTWPEQVPDSSCCEQFRQLISQRVAGVPIAYLIGTREFWSLDFKVTRDTLIPRPDTELLVQLAIDSLRKNPGPTLDLGTGSGAIAISIAHEINDIGIDATDINEAAIAVAKENARRNNTTVNFVHSNWFEQVEKEDYQLVVSNPPYIATHDPHLQTGGLQYEPAGALVSANNGYADIEHIIQHAHGYCVDGAWLMIEHGYTQGQTTRELMQQCNYRQVQTKCDIENRERVTMGQIAPNTFNKATT